HEVEQNLTELFAVRARHDRRGGRLDAVSHSLPHELRLDHWLELRHRRREIHRFDRVVEMPRLDARQIEHVVDETQQMPLAAVDAAQGYALLLGDRAVDAELDELQ